MKRMMKQITVLLLAGVLFSGCRDDDYSPDNYWVDIATVENPQKKSDFFLRLDDSTRLWTEESDISNYRPSDGQRVIAYYSVLSDKRGTGYYDYDVKLNDVFEVLTKGIFKMTPEKQDSIGNDPVHVSDMWIGSKFLNVEFYYLGYSKTHYINLVSDSTKTYADDKIHLEFRHNANNDDPFHKRWGIVSFDISSLQASTADSVNLVIHVKRPEQEDEKLVELTYRYHNNASSGVVKKVKMNKPDGYARENEIK
ncbi:MAG: NigD-like protein [Paludibacter sp.]|nr:NigD-like protein [Paludibacter sp.]MDD4198725.1 NigD-like protein [Paludibacter sp.]MDD4428428.1 NigD-like protein [Paludibacter sp.]